MFGSAQQNAVAQDSGNLPYLNPQLSPEQRATDLVRRMTLAEKASEMQNNSAAVPRLKIPAYQWWSEAFTVSSKWIKRLAVEIPVSPVGYKSSSPDVSNKRKHSQV